MLLHSRHTLPSSYSSSLPLPTAPSPYPTATEPSKLTPTPALALCGGRAVPQRQARAYIGRPSERLDQSKKFNRSSLTPHFPRRRILTKVCNDSPNTRRAISASHPSRHPSRHPTIQPRHPPAGPYSAAMLLPSRKPPPSRPNCRHPSRRPNFCSAAPRRHPLRRRTHLAGRTARQVGDRAWPRGIWFKRRQPP